MMFGHPDAGAHMKVQDLKLNGKDSNDDTIEKLYARSSPYYAVYRAVNRVLVWVHFADKGISDSEGRELEQSQRRELAKLNELRAQIHGLIDGWRVSERFKAKADRYDARTAAALILCMEGDTASAKASLVEIKSDVLAERNSWGRFEYLIYAGSLAILIALVLTCAWLGAAGPTVITPPVPLGTSLWLSGIGGAIGALFSIALGIRSRTVLTSLNRRDNIADAILRVAIGLISSWALLVLLRAELLTGFTIGGAELSGKEVTFEVILLIGFVAGFFERLVPDLLEKKADEKSPAEKTSAVETAKAVSEEAEGKETKVSATAPGKPKDEEAKPDEKAKTAQARANGAGAVRRKSETAGTIRRARPDGGPTAQSE
jgi:hypothetical protein